MYPRDSSVADGVLSIGGCDALELAREFGTPAYVVAEDDLRARARAFTEVLAQVHDGHGEVVFASKAFPCTAVLRVFAEEGLGCDVASGGELHLALRAGFDPARLYLHGNAKSDAELELALQAGVGTVVVDNEEEADRLQALGGGPRLLIRVTPGVDADTHEQILTGHAGSKFGMPPDAARAARRQARPRRPAHAHRLPAASTSTPYRRAVAALATLGDFDVYDLGGGLGVAYTPGDDAVDGRLGDRRGGRRARAARRRQAARARARPRARGQRRRDALHASSRSSRGAAGERLVAVDGGMSDNLRPMLYGAAYDAALADRVGAAGTPARWSASTASPATCWSATSLLPDPRPGDVLVTPVTGAYGYAMANNYNGVPRPPVVFCAGGDARVVVRRETYEDLSGRDV